MAYSAKDFEDLIAKWAKTSEGKSIVEKSKQENKNPIGSSKGGLGGGISGLSPTVKRDFTTYDEKTVLSYAEELKRAIVNAYKTTFNADFNDSPIKISVSYNLTPQARREGYDGVIEIEFPKESIWRPSLFEDENCSEYLIKSHRNPDGVYDIIGLLSSGWRMRNRAPMDQYGYWRHTVSGEVEEDVSILPSRKENFFLRDVISKFEKSHPGLKVEYPKTWGDKRIHFYLL